MNAVTANPVTDAIPPADTALTLHAGRTRRGVTAVTARLSGETVHADTLNLARAADRNRFAAALAERCPALAAADVADELLRVRDDLAARGPGPKHAATGGDPTRPTVPTAGEPGDADRDGGAAGDGAGPAVIVLGTQEWKANGKAVAALARLPWLYKRGTSLVRVIRAGDAEPGEVAGGGRVARPDEAPTVAELKPPHVRDALTRVAAFVNVKDDGDEPRAVPAHPPGWLVQFVHLAGVYPGVRPLDGIAAGPVLRPDGSVLAAPGYDPATRLLLPESAVAGVPPVPDEPTADEVAAALALLLDVAADFPFAGDAHRAAWVASLLTVLARPAFAGPAPMFVITANAPSAGKSLLAEVTVGIALGRPPAVMGTGGSDEEMDKRITALAMAGDPVVQLDNIGRGDALGGPALDRALTAEVWTGRVLGESRIFTAPLRCVFFATGNNVAFAADTPRRVVPVRLESPHERPEDRDPAAFRHPDLKRYVRANRGRLLAAGMTLLRAYFVAGRPEPPGGRRALGSFEGWSETVRDAVVWAGLADPLDAREVLGRRGRPGRRRGGRRAARAARAGPRRRRAAGVRRPRPAGGEPGRPRKPARRRPPAVRHAARPPAGRQHPGPQAGGGAGRAAGRAGAAEPPRPRRRDEVVRPPRPARRSRRWGGWGRWGAGRSARNRPGTRRPRPAARPVRRRP